MFAICIFDDKLSSAGYNYATLETLCLLVQRISYKAITLIMGSMSPIYTVNFELFQIMCMPVGQELTQFFVFT